MLNKTTDGRIVCDEHPDVQIPDEVAGVIHLENDHPQLWAKMQGVTMDVLTSRKDKRRAQRAARRSNRQHRPR